MAIISTDLAYYLSGGELNSLPNNSLGGVKSTTKIVNNTLHNLFDKVSNSESTSGDIEYRCVYLTNNHESLPLLEAFVFVSSPTPSEDTSIEIGIGSSELGATEQTVLNESTAPTGVSFTTAEGDINALDIGEIPAGSYQALWIKRTVNSGASARNSDGAGLQFGGGTSE